MISQVGEAIAPYSASAEDIEMFDCFLVLQDSDEFSILMQHPVNHFIIIGQKVQSIPQ